MIKGIGHLGLFVKDIESTVTALAKIVDIEPPEVKEFPDAGLRCAVVDLNGIGLEMIQDAGPDGPLAQMLQEKGDMIHHFCLLSDSIEADVEKLKERGVPMADQEPRVGLRGRKIALSTPEALNGITIELSEP
ncbi:MAG: VOC family protein [Deltaproteobacteria bacterium]|nr:VOC family protein [Deltaproteobacteria bacterium]